jgi:hypothetical protein
VSVRSSALRWCVGLVVGAAAVLSTLAPEAGALAAKAMCLGAPTTIDGTPWNDVIHGTPAGDSIAVFAGNDTVYGRGGNDRLCGGRGGDVLFDGTGSDAIDGGDGIDLLYLCPDGSFDRWRNVERVVRSTRACT